jgi:hypothetical protein
MEKKVALLLLFLISAAFAQSQSRATKKNRGAWSGYAVSLFNTWGAFDDNPGRKADFRSPDGHKLVRVRGESVSVLIDGKVFSTKVGEMTNGELMWSPDSNYFLVTYTDGGALGTWAINLFKTAAGELTDLGKISRKAAGDYEARIKLRSRPHNQPLEIWETTEYCHVNVVSVKWLSATRLAVAALVPGTSACRRMSDWDGYIVNVPSGEIEERVAARNMIKRFGSDNVPRRD